LPGYDKIKIKTLCDKYLETENPDDFGKLLMALEPMVRTIVNRWNTLQRHHEDMVQEILMTIWRKQSNVNKLKLTRMKRDQNGDRIHMATYFYFVTRGYCGKVAPRMEKLYSSVNSYRSWFMINEDWVGYVEDVERYRKNDESHIYMENLKEVE